MAERKKIALIVAGGTGRRMGNAMPKQFLLLHGKPVLYYAITAFQQAFSNIEIILVLPAAQLQQANNLVEIIKTNSAINIVAGGETRFHSVQNGLKKITGSSIIFVHDGVRPLVSVSLIKKCYEEALQHGSAIPCIKTKDSLRQIINADKSKAVDRSQYCQAQTPQTFHSEILLSAFEQEYSSQYTDEATVVEHNGSSIHLTEGEEENIKITRPLDLVIAEKIMEGSQKL